MTTYGISPDLDFSNKRDSSVYDEITKQNTLGHSKYCPPAGPMTVGYSFSVLQKSLDLASETNSKAHALQFYHTSLYNYINSKKFDVREIPGLLQEIDSFVSYLHHDENKEILALISQPIRISIAKNYVSLLTRSKLKLYEITNNFVSTFNESSKKINAHLKNLVIVILSFIYESFGRDVSSFIPLIISLVLKYLRKDDINSMNLARLLTSTIRNGGILDVTDSITTKYFKLVKNSSEAQVQAELINSLGVISSAKSVDLITYKSSYLSIFSSGLSSSHLQCRINTAKALAESLVAVQYNLKDVFDVFIELYIESVDPRQQIGVIESATHFTSIKYAHDFDFLNANFVEITNCIISIFKHERFLSFTENAKNRLFEHLDVLFKTLIDLTDESNQRILLEYFFKALDQRPSLTYNSVLVLHIVHAIFGNLTSLTNNEIEKYHITLWRLSTSSDQEETRNAAIQVLKIFASKFPNILNELLDTSLNELINISKQTTDKIQNKTLGFSMILANLICLADKENIPDSLIQNIWAYNSNYIKMNMEITEANFHGLMTSWIALAGVFTYKDPNFINSKVDEFMTIWESLKIYEQNGPPSLVLIDKSLVALLSFLNNIPTLNKSVANFFIDKLIAKQPVVNVLKKRDDEFKGVVKSIEHRFFQIYLILVDYIKSEKSSVLIQAVHNFSNFSDCDVRLLGKDSKKPSLGTDNLLFYQGDNSEISTGLTSKFLGYKIDELNLKFKEFVYSQTRDYSIDFSSVKPRGSIGVNRLKSCLDDSTWVEVLETTLLVNPVASSLRNDYLQPILKDGYSLYRRYAPPASIGVVDSSIEIFSKSFSSLSSKVQLSLLETLRSHLLSKDNNRLAQLVLAINTSIVLNGVLTVADKEAHRFDKDVGTLILETLRNIYQIHQEDSNVSKYLLVLNSESIGLLLSMTSLTEQIPIFIKRIVDEEDSGSRSFNSLVLSYVYQFDSSSQFNSILEILLKLATDPHPYVHFWALDSLATIVDKHVVINTHRAVEILEILRNCYLDDSFGVFGSGSMAYLNLEFDSNVIISRVLRSLLNSLGPTINDLDSSHREILQILVWGLFFNHNNSKVQIEMLKLLQNIVVYDASFVPIEKLVDILKFVVTNNLLTQHIGSTFSLSIYEERNELFPLTSSDILLNIACDLLFQLVRTSEDKTFLNELDSLIWVCLELNPESEILERLVHDWIDATCDISWFTKLQKLFFSSKYVIYEAILSNYRNTLNKFRHKRVEVDVKDEEAQSIAQREDTDGSKNVDKASEQILSKTESTSWKFQLVILKSLRQLLGYCLRDSKLYQQLSNKVPEMIKISYESSTSSITELRLVGIELLGDIIQIYSSAKDPIYPTMSLLEQQQAQITSALIPSFQRGSTPLLASQAIKVVALFIGSKVVPVSKLNRVGKILINSLVDLQNGEEDNEDEFKISEVVIFSEMGQRRVKLSILNSWAELKIIASKYQAHDELDNELNELVNNHLDLLLPLWISSLKEYALIQHGNSGSKSDADLFQDCWINFVDVVGLITEECPGKIAEILGVNEAGFYYMVYSHCMYSLLGNNSLNLDKVTILEGLLKILNYKELSDIIFHEDIYHETIDIFERLMITGSLETKLVLIDITTTIFMNSHCSESFDEKADKLFEIIRVNLQPILNYVPISGELETFEPLTSAEIYLLKKSFSSITRMISKFPDVIKFDLYSTVLAIVAKIITNNNIIDLVPHVLPVLKEILIELTKMNCLELVNNFYQIVKPQLSRLDSMNSLLTLSVLFTSTSLIKLQSDDIERFTDVLVAGLSNQSLGSIVTQTLKNIIAKPDLQNEIILKGLIPKLILQATAAEDPRIYVELVILVLKQFSDRQYSLFSIVIPSLLAISEKEGPFQLKEYAHKRLLMLVSTNPEVFRKVVTEFLTADQKQATERLVKMAGDVDYTENGSSDVKIKLKSFV